jgi:hypothetical protein
LCGPFPLPAHRTQHADFPHYALRLVSSRAYDGWSHERPPCSPPSWRRDIACSEGSRFHSVVCRLTPIHTRHPLRQAHQKSGSFPPPALPDINGRMTLSDPRQHRRPAATSRPLPSCQTDIPQLPGSPFEHAVPITPMDRDGCVCRLLPHPTRALPVIQAGRRPSLHFRGLLRLHSRYGLLDCSTAYAAFVTRLRSSRLPS